MERRGSGFGGLPSGLAAVGKPRARGDTFLPKSAAPADRVLAVPLAGLRRDERVAVTCLQGLHARERPRLWLIRNADDPFWMDWHRAKGFVKDFETVTNCDHGGQTLDSAGTKTRELRSPELAGTENLSWQA